MAQAYTPCVDSAETIVAVDIAKSVFQLYEVDLQTGEVFETTLKRKDFNDYFRNKALSIVVMEACSTAKFWARKIKELKHQVFLLPPKHVKPFVQGCKSDRADAQGIYRAFFHVRPIVRPNTIELQTLQSIIGLRRQSREEMTCKMNCIRSHLAEFGFDMPKSTDAFFKEASARIGELEEEVHDAFLIAELRKRFNEVDKLRTDLIAFDKELKRRAEGDKRGQHFLTMPGVGPLIACVMMIILADPSVFENGRQVGAFLGLVPGHTGSGGKIINGRITKRGNSYFRSLLVQGALSACRRRNKEPWVEKLIQRMPRKKAAVALANRMVRQMYAMAVKDEDYTVRMI